MHTQGKGKFKVTSFKFCPIHYICKDQFQCNSGNFVSSLVD